MNKAELIESVAVIAGSNKSQAANHVNAVLKAIGDALSKGDDVSVTGFGSFKVKHRAARTGRNPQTREEIQIPASKTVGFKVGAVLKAQVN